MTNVINMRGHRVFKLRKMREQYELRRELAREIAKENFIALSSQLPPRDPLGKHLRALRRKMEIKES